MVLTSKGKSIHPMWLRERCLSADSVQVETRQPLHQPHDFQWPMKISSAMVTDNRVLQVAWAAPSPRSPEPACRPPHRRISGWPWGRGHETPVAHRSDAASSCPQVEFSDGHKSTFDVVRLEREADNLASCGVQMPEINLPQVTRSLGRVQAVQADSPLVVAIHPHTLVRSVTGQALGQQRGGPQGRLQQPLARRLQRGRGQGRQPQAAGSDHSPSGTRPV